MAIVVLPTRRDLPNSAARVELDGVIYTVGIRWNSRMGRWILDLSSADGAPALLGLPLVADYSINGHFSRFSREGTPPGLLVVADLANFMRDPDLQTLGQDVKLHYSEA